MGKVDDLFGLESERKIIKSGVKDIFTPYTPVDEIEHLVGRVSDVKRMISLISGRGQHILIYGDRGVGKTSLAKSTCKLILDKISRGSLKIKSCDNSDKFSSLFLEPLREIGIDTSLQSHTKSLKQSGNTGINAHFAKASIQSERQTNATYNNQFNLNSPTWIAEQLKKFDCIFLIDEVDTLVSKDDKHKLAQLIKALSDCNADFKIIIVGIAKTSNELTDGHPSVQRCLKEIHLDRMSDEDIRKIVLNGMKNIKPRRIPTDSVVNRIVDISSGFPHFTHLICLKSAEIAISNNLTHIDDAILDKALEEVARDIEATFSDNLAVVLRGTNNTQEYKLILLAAAHCQKKDFKSSELSSKIKQLYDTPISSTTLSARLKKLSKPDNGSNILVKTARGCYSFKDPRMPSFIKIKLNHLLEGIQHPV